MRKLVAVFIAVVSMLVVAVAPASATDGHDDGRDSEGRSAFDGLGTTTVRPGQSIQTAIDRAHPGDIIIIKGGRYAENLFITKPISLRGHGRVTITQPKKPSPNLCSFDPESGTIRATGICIVGEIDPDTFEVLRPVGPINLSGLTIKGFDGEGAFAFGAMNLTATDSEFSNNGGYGIFANTSSNVVFAGLDAHDNGEAGLYIGDSAGVNATVIGNRSWNNDAEGLLFRDSTGGTIAGNEFTGNCVGILVLDTGSGGPGNAGQARVLRNTVSENNNACPGDGEAPPLSGLGIGVAGAHDVVVSGNVVTRNKPSGPSALQGGVFVVDTSGFGGTAPARVLVSHNSVKRNRPTDLFWDGSGSAITFNGNRCGTSVPSGNC